MLAAFDSAAESLRDRDIPVPLHSTDGMEDFIRENKVQMAVLCVPANFAQQVANNLIQAGIQGILNFSPVVLEVPAEVTVNNVDLALELENLNYFIRRK